MSSRPGGEAASQESRPVTVPRFVDAKKRGQKLSVLTAYDFLWAGLLDAAGVDALLVGEPGKITFEITSKLVGEGVAVSDDEVREAMRFARYLNDQRGHARRLERARELA